MADCYLRRKWGCLVSILAIICLNFTFPTIFLVKNGHRAIKVHVNKVHYGRAGHKYSLWINIYPKIVFAILQLSIDYF